MGRMANQKLAVVYITHRHSNEEEKLLLKYSLLNLVAYDKFLVVPDGMKVQQEFGDFTAIQFNSNYFSHINGYNELLMTSFFYRHFEAYENILILQPDCVVLKPGIDEFCGKSLYLGASFNAPKFINRLWLMKFPTIGHLLSRLKIGKRLLGYNGGFSIRNIPYFIKHAPALGTTGKRLLYREDIIYSYIFLKEHAYNAVLSDRFCLEEKLDKYRKLDEIAAFGLHDPLKYNCEIYREILERSESL
jgi:hypothetical protein